MQGGTVTQLLQEEGVPLLVDGPLQHVQVASLKEILCEDIPRDGQRGQGGKPQGSQYTWHDVGQRGPAW